jgi:polyhydroxybutyrate depolymerase
VTRLWIALCLLIVACDNVKPLTCDGEHADPECHSIVVGSATRVYLLHVPATYRAGAPLVIGLHGVGELGPRFRDVSQLSVMADTLGFAIAYPNATPVNGVATWDAYFNFFGDHPPDDIGFLRQLITTLRAQLGADPKRVYVVGLSNGGLMTHRVAVELSDLVAAVADVAGTLASSSQSISLVPTPAHGVSVLMLHGDSDFTVPCCTFKSATSLEETFDYWAGAQGDGCASVSTTESLCKDSETPNALPSKRATGCRDGSEVQFYMLFGGRHGWYQGALTDPGGEAYNPLFADSIGTTMNDVIWHWLETHPKR